MSTVVNRIRADARQAEEALAAVAKAARGETDTAPTDAATTPASNEAPAAPAVPPAPPVTPAAVVEPVGTAAPADSEALRQQLQLTEQQYRSLQGMFARQSGEFEAVKRQLDEVLRAQRTSNEPAADTTPAPVKRVTDHDRKEYGDELIDLMRRAAAEAVSAQLIQLERRLQKLETDVPKRLKDVEGRVQSTAETVQLTAAEKFEAALEVKVPDWEKINVMPQWLTWLGQRDPLSGIVRQQLLDNAVASMDATRTAMLFTAFKQESGMSASGATAPKSDGARVDPASLAAPASSRAAVSTPSATQGKKMYTLREVEKLYDDRTRGRIPAAEWTRIEADINQAILEGRVT